MRIRRRRFAVPWRVIEIPGGWKITDANGFALVYVYGDDRPRPVADHRMTKDEARASRA